MQSAKIIPLMGSNTECGYAQGQYAKANHDINSVLAAIRRIQILPYGLQQKIPLGLYRVFLKATGKRFLKYHAELFATQRHKVFRDRLTGLSEGLGESMELVYGINALEVITSKMPYRVPSLGCSSLIFPTQATLTQQPMLAY